jgi:hypothetical protein
VLPKRPSGTALKSLSTVGRLVEERIASANNPCAEYDPTEELAPAG